MLSRGLLFAAWALLGGVLSYGVLYLVSPMGFMIVAACALAGLALPRGLEALGLVAGPGLLLLLAAQAGDDPALGIAGATIVVAALVTYTLVGRARCARIT